MSNIVKIPVTIVTGFLGSGKTTLIKNLIEKNIDKRIAIIVNEFGDIGVDGEILKSCAIPNCPAENIVELSNGCICCTVADDFIPTVSALIKMNPMPSQIIIETSGLALPKPLLKAFNWPEISSKITVDSVIALSDAEAVSSMRFAPSIEAVERQRIADENIEHDTPLSEVFKDQINCADIVLLTKTDLVSEDELDIAKKYINEISDRNISILENQNGNIDPSVILDLDFQSEKDLLSRKSHHDDHTDYHDHDDFESFVLELNEVKDQDFLVKKIQTFINIYSVLRVKGYIEVKDKPMRFLIQAVGSRIRTQFDRMWEINEIRKSRLVFITQSHTLKQNEITKFFKN